MTQQPPAEPIVRSRNRAAQAALVIAALFLTQCVVFVAIIVFFTSPGGIQFVTKDPTNPWASLGEVVVELSILFFPLDLLAGALTIVLGIVGLRRAGRLPGRLGKRRSTFGILAGATLLVWPFVTFLWWARGWRQ